jgi:chemotaxis protein methyltransferase CheR
MELQLATRGLAPDICAMSQEEYLLLNELVSCQFGIAFPEHKRDLLEARLRPRLQALHLRRFFDYYLMLQCDRNGERESLVELVTNNETFFFRETAQFEAFFEEAARKPRGGRKLRLLCAGCSSGEEPYTLAIFAQQNILTMSGAAVEIDAFDLDNSRIEMAHRAEYGRSALRSLTAPQVDRYLAPVAPERWSLKPFYRAGIRFATGNILELSTFAPAVPYDAVFCRNVLIYFSEPALHRAVDHFAEVLRPGGLLFLGAAESIIGLSDRFETARLSRSIVYRKVE